MNNVIIRQETPEDYNAVYELVKQAFSTTIYSDGTEQDYLNDIRNKDCFIPELSFVGVKKGAAVDQIVLYKMQIACNEAPITQLVVSPLWFCQLALDKNDSGGIGEFQIERKGK